MKRILTLVLLTLVALGTGCVKVHMDTTITADGSGTATISYTMSREVADALTKLMATNPGSLTESGDFSDFMDLRRDKLAAACKTTGVELLDHQFKDDESGRELVMKLGFKTVGDLSRALGALDEDAGGKEHEELRIERTEDGNYRLHNVTVPGDGSTTEVVEETTGSEQDMARMQESMQYFGVLMSHMEEMDIRLTVTVPGEVISSNAMEVEGHTSIWAVNAANMMAAEDMDMEPNIVFSREGVTIKTD